MRSVQSLTLSLTTAFAALGPAIAQCLPVTGCERPELAAVDDAMLAFMCDNDIPGGTLAIARDGVVIYQRGFGQSDEAESIPMQPRTMAAVRELIADGAFTLDSFAFDLGQPEGGLLDLEPFPTLGDPRLAQVRVRHLIDHRGGWDRGIAGDLTYRETLIAAQMGVQSPPGRENTVRWILGQPLQFDPDARRSYSNIGGLMLGLIVEQESGKPLAEFIHERVLSPIGIEDADHIAGRTFADDHDPREPHYHATGSATNVFDPFGPPVSAPYGGWDHEARVGQGGQVATAGVLATVAAHRWVNGSNIGKPKSPTQSGTWRWNHTGTLTGTGALIRQRGDGITYGVIFNTRGFGGDIRGVLDPVLDAITDWPAGEPSCCLPDLNNDNVLTGADFFEFLGRFSANDLSIDFASAASPTTPDGLLTGADFFRFLELFTLGC